MLHWPLEEEAPRPPGRWLLRGLLLLIVGGGGALGVTRPEWRLLAGVLAVAGLHNLLALPALTAEDDAPATRWWRPGSPLLLLAAGGLLLASWREASLGLPASALSLAGAVIVGVGALLAAAEPALAVRTLRPRLARLTAAVPETLPASLGECLKGVTFQAWRDFLTITAHQAAHPGASAAVLAAAGDRISEEAQRDCRLRQAWRALRRADLPAANEVLAQLDDPQTLAWEAKRQVLALTAALRLAAGRPGEAAELAHAATGPPALAGAEWFEFCALLQLAARVEMAGADFGLSEAVSWAGVLQASLRPQSPYLPRLNHLLARLCLAQGDPETALAHLADAPGDLLRVRALAALGRADVARQLSEALLGKAEADWPRADALRERARLRLAAGEAGRAEQDAREALRLWPSDGEAALLLAAALGAQDSSEERAAVLGELAAGDETRAVVRQARRLLAEGLPPDTERQHLS